jgi:hypothetical protein
LSFGSPKMPHTKVVLPELRPCWRPAKRPRLQRSDGEMRKGPGTHRALFLHSFVPGEERSKLTAAGCPSIRKESAPRRPPSSRSSATNIREVRCHHSRDNGHPARHDRSAGHGVAGGYDACTKGSLELLQHAGNQAAVPGVAEIGRAELRALEASGIDADKFMPWNSCVAQMPQDPRG